VPVAITITGVPDKGHIVITTKNLEKLGEVGYIFEIDEVDIPLIEELAKLLIGKPNQFRTMGKHQQPVRAAPRARQAPVEAEPEPPGMDDPSIEDDNVKKGLFGSLKSLLKRKPE